MSEMAVEDTDDADDDVGGRGDETELELELVDSAGVIKLIGEFGGTMWWLLVPSNIFLYI
jgi:hypothetical protein